MRLPGGPSSFYPFRARDGSERGDQDARRSGKMQILPPNRAVAPALTTFRIDAGGGASEVLTPVSKHLELSLVSGLWSLVSALHSPLSALRPQTNDSLDRSGLVERENPA
jgi:hypothetical protein